MSKTAAKKPAAARKPAAKQRPQRAPGGKRAAILEAAKAGKLPAPPNFKAETHKRWRPMLTEIVALAKDGGLAQLKGYKIPSYSSTSPNAIRRFRDLAVLALTARAGAK